MSTNAGDALDPAVLAALRDLSAPGQPDVLQEVLELFLQDAGGRIAAIAAAVDHGDAAALERAAHTMKGAAAAIGASGLQHACRALEELGKLGVLDDAPQRLAQLRGEFGRAREAIQLLL